MMATKMSISSGLRKKMTGEKSFLKVPLACFQSIQFISESWKK